jgi:hypothetical protein
MNFLTNLNLSQNQIQNALMHPLGTPPAGVESQVYYNLTDHLLYVHNGTTWVAVGAPYTLPTASATVLGGIKIGSGLSIDGNGVVTTTEQANAIESIKVNGDALTVTTKAVDILITTGTLDGTIKINGTDIAVAGLESGAYAAAYVHPNHTGDITSTGDGATVITNKAVTLAKMADIATASLLGRKTAAIGAPEVLSKSDVLTLLNVQDGAQVNAVDSVAVKTGVVTLAKDDVGLGNVTNDAQVKKADSSTDGNVPVWSGVTGDALGAGYGIETTLAGATTKIPRADAVKNYIDGLLSANDAMIFKGTLGSGGTITVLPTTYSAGWAYKIITAGTYAGVACEVGDLIIAIVDRAGTGNVNSDWTVVQTNLDGAVIGPASSTDGNFVLFNGASGKLIKNSTYSPSSFSASTHNHDTVYPKKYTTTLGGSTSQVVTHNLNTRDLTVTIRETESPYAQIITDVEFTTVNTLTVLFAVAPTANQYTITLVG